MTTFSSPDDPLELVTKIHAAPGKVSLVVTGAGAQALAWLFAVPGASRTVLTAFIPYSAQSLNDFTGRISEQHVSAGEASVMARSALEEAKRVHGETELVAAVSCTAAIATDRVRRGQNRCHVAIAKLDGEIVTYSLVLEKGQRNRQGEEDVVSRLVVNAVAEAKEVQDRLNVPLTANEKIESSQEPAN